jgi:hypothetical protein
VDSIEITWPNGQKQALDNIPANQIFIVRSPAK